MLPFARTTACPPIQPAPACIPHTPTWPAASCRCRAGRRAGRRAGCATPIHGSAPASGRSPQFLAARPAGMQVQAQPTSLKCIARKLGTTQDTWRARRRCTLQPCSGSGPGSREHSADQPAKRPRAGEPRAGWLVGKACAQRARSDVGPAATRPSGASPACPTLASPIPATSSKKMSCAVEGKHTLMCKLRKRRPKRLPHGAETALPSCRPVALPAVRQRTLRWLVDVGDVCTHTTPQPPQRLNELTSLCAYCDLGSTITTGSWQGVRSWVHTRRHLPHPCPSASA